MRPQTAINLLMAAALALVVWDYASTRALAREQAGTIAAQAVAIDTLQGNYTRLDAALQAKQQFDNQTRARLATLARRQEELRREDPEVDAWMGTPVPAALRGLRDHPGPPADLPAPAGPPRAD